jgi:hypothetical protein
MARSVSGTHIVVVAAVAAVTVAVMAKTGVLAKLGS